MNAKQLIERTEIAAAMHQRRTGCDDSTRREYEVCALQGKLFEACEKLAAATNPPGCYEIESDFVRYGVKWDAGDEVWCIYIGGQNVSHVTPSGLYRELCEEAKRIALDGEAA